MVLVIFFLVYLTLACKELEETKILFIELGEKVVNIDSQKKVEISANELMQVDDTLLDLYYNCLPCTWLPFFSMFGRPYKLLRIIVIKDVSGR
jgi:hypothetical protein